MAGRNERAGRCVCRKYIGIGHFLKEVPKGAASSQARKNR